LVFGGLLFTTIALKKEYLFYVNFTRWFSVFILYIILDKQIYNKIIK